MSDTLSLKDAAEMLWVVLANVSGGDWTKQTPEWQEAAARWRDAYFVALKAHPSPSAPDLDTLARETAQPVKYLLPDANAYFDYVAIIRRSYDSALASVAPPVAERPAPDLTGLAAAIDARADDYASPDVPLTWREGYRAGLDAAKDAVRDAMRTPTP